jgi:hypothetical protein
MEGDSGAVAQPAHRPSLQCGSRRVDAPQPQRAPAVRARSWHLYGRRSAPRAPVGGRGRLLARRALRAYPARRRRLDVRRHRALATGTALARGGGRRIRRRLRGVRRRGAAVVPSIASDHVRRLDRRRRWGQRREAGPAAEGRTRRWRALLYGGTGESTPSRRESAPCRREPTAQFPESSEVAQFRVSMDRAKEPGKPHLTPRYLWRGTM